MSHHWFNRQEVLEKAKDRYHNDGGKEKAAEYYIPDKVFIKQKAKNKDRKLSQDEKEAKNEYSWNRYKNMKENID